MFELSLKICCCKVIIKLGQEREDSAGALDETLYPKKKKKKLSRGGENCYIYIVRGDSEAVQLEAQGQSLCTLLDKQSGEGSEFASKFSIISNHKDLLPLPRSLSFLVFSLNRFLMSS